MWIGDYLAAGIRDKVRKRLERQEKTYETEQLMKEKRSEEYEALEEVFDKPTLMTIYNLMNKGEINEIHGSIKAGKESKLYFGTRLDGTELAIKIYLTSSKEFRRGMIIYIEGDPRFSLTKRDTRSLIFAWARKEFKNLQRASNNGIRVPKPIYIEKNVLVMEFIGEEDVAAPTLKEVPPRKPQQMYNLLLKYVKLLYQKAKLVHGDLSEYNIMHLNDEPVIFDDEPISIRRRI